MENKSYFPIKNILIAIWVAIILWIAAPFLLGFFDGEGEMYWLWENVSFMYYENMDCRLIASQKRNICIEELLTQVWELGNVPWIEITKCDTIGNDLLNNCENQINWEEIRKRNSN